MPLDEELFGILLPALITSVTVIWAAAVPARSRNALVNRVRSLMFSPLIPPACHLRKIRPALRNFSHPGYVGVEHARPPTVDAGFPRIVVNSIYGSTADGGQRPV